METPTSSGAESSTDDAATGTSSENTHDASSDFGLKIVHEATFPDDPSNPPINIIFVHGLNGSARETWVNSKSGSFWPEWLPEVKGLENSRILTFGYDSRLNKIWAANNVLDISDFAKQLANDLWLHYAQYPDVFSVFVIFTNSS